jgi:hypothetical protein
MVRASPVDGARLSLTRVVVPRPTGKVGPLDTYRGFRDIGFGVLLSLYAAIVIPLAMGWLTNDKYVPTYLRRRQLCVVSCDLMVCACACAKVELVAERADQGEEHPQGEARQRLADV